MKCLLQARPDTGTRGLMVALTGGLPRVARKHTGCLVKFENQIKNIQYFSMFPEILEPSYTKKKKKENYAFFIRSLALTGHLTFYLATVPNDLS